MKILVTGGAGYIGSMLVAELLNRGHSVIVLDNFMYGQTSLNHLCAYNDLKIVKGDCRDVRLLKDVLEDRPQVVIPLAALVGAPLCDNDQLGAWSTNVDAVAILTRLLSKEQRIIIPISNSGYGVGEAGKECTEESPLKPISVYGRTKVAAEQIVMDRGNAVSLRLATAFGMSPRMRLDLLVNDFVYRAAKDKAVTLFEPHFKRNYIHVRDIVNVIVMALQSHAMKDQIFNVGLSNANLSKWELCERIAKQVPGFVFNEAPVGKDPDQRDYIVSNAKIEAVGFHLAWGIDYGIKELLKGYVYLNDRHYGNA